MPDEHPYAQPKPHPALRRLDFLAGSWTLHGSTFESLVNTPGEVTGQETFEWLPGGFFLVHRWELSFLLIGKRILDTGYQFFDYDPAAPAYRSHIFNTLGPYDQRKSTYTGHFEDETLFLTGPSRISRKPNADATITVHVEIPLGHGKWVPLMTYTLTRTA